MCSILYTFPTGIIYIHTHNNNMNFIIWLVGGMMLDLIIEVDEVE